VTADPPTPTPPGRILVVDDHEMNRDMLSRRLRRLGHQVDVAVDGQDALTALRDGNSAHDLLLLDIMMPNMDGYEVLRRLKADQALRDLPVIMISALDDMDSVVRCIELGADDHLPKPFNPVLLQARIGACLEKKRLRDLEKRHAESMKRELEIGRAIQQGFLPREMPAVPGWDIAARFQPARQVAGDFYDVFTLPGGRALALVVADVCDKGVGAALFMALCRSLLRATAIQRFAAAPEPATTLAATPVDGGDGAAGPAGALGYTVAFVNDYIAGIHAQANMFATLVFGILDPTTGELLYVNAGHDAPLVVSGAEVRAALPPTGPAIGLMPGLPFAVARATLRPGDLLLAYTDGVTDARGAAGDAFGEARLRETVTAAAGSPGSPGSAAGVVAALLAAVEAHAAGAEPFDDVTLLAVRRLGSEDQAGAPRPEEDEGEPGQKQEAGP
jgi:phosphoserine phosphatase RsbU/P